MGLTLNKSQWTLRVERQWETYPLGLPHRIPRAKEVLDVVSRVTRISIADIQSNRKTADIVIARRLYHFLTKEMTHYSYPYIGKLVNQDHTTVIHNVAVSEKLLRENDADFTRLVNKAKQFLKELILEGEDAYDTLVRLQEIASNEAERKTTGRSSRVNRGSSNPLEEAASIGRVRLSAAE